MEHVLNVKHLEIKKKSLSTKKVGLSSYIRLCDFSLYNTEQIYCFPSALTIYAYIAEIFLCIVLTAVPSPPHNVAVTSGDLQRETFSIVVSWDAVDDVEYVVYTNSSNSTQVVYTNTSNMATLEGKYNMVINVTLAAINCVGRSEITTYIFVGKYIYMYI